MTTKNYKRQPIKLYINSNGGDVNDTFGLISIIKSQKHPYIHIVQDMHIVQHFIYL